MLPRFARTARYPSQTGVRKARRGHRAPTGVCACRKPLADKLARIEKEMEVIGAERQSIEAWLTTPDAYVEEGKERCAIPLPGRAISPGSSRGSRLSGSTVSRDTGKKLWHPDAVA